MDGRNLTMDVLSREMETKRLGKHTFGFRKLSIPQEEVSVSDGQLDFSSKRAGNSLDFAPPSLRRYFTCAEGSHYTSAQ